MYSHRGYAEHPKNRPHGPKRSVDRAAFVSVISADKVAKCIAEWTPPSGLDRELLADLAKTRGVPGILKRKAEEQQRSRRRGPIHVTWLVENSETRVFSREEFYELVWSQPMTALAQRFGISDVALHKRCKAMNVPTPGRGYWEQIKHGRTLRRAALPKLPRDPDSRGPRKS